MARRLSKRIGLALSVASTALVIAPQPAAAATFGPVSWAKTDAIQGGAPSALEAILAQQGGQPALARAAWQPASFSLPQATSAGGDRLTPSAAVLSGRPDIFGSVALRVDHTP